MNIPNIKVEQFYGKNQFKIITKEGILFQSYGSTIVFVDTLGNTALDEKYWDYSKTTGKYRNKFLGEGIDETRRKIENREYILMNLNI